MQALQHLWLQLSFPRSSHNGPLSPGKGRQKHQFRTLPRADAAHRTEGSPAGSRGAVLAAEQRTHAVFPGSGRLCGGRPAEGSCTLPNAGNAALSPRAEAQGPRTGTAEGTRRVVAAASAAPLPALSASVHGGARLPSLPGISGSQRQKCCRPSCRPGLLERVVRALDLVLETPPLKLVPVGREGWVGRMTVPVPAGGPRPKGE